MDCDLARHLLQFARPGTAELEPADAAALEKHLADCPDCGPATRAERAFDARIARAMPAVPLAADFHARLGTHLLAARAAWWRQFSLRFGAAGAALLLAAGAAWWFWGRPTLDPYAEVQRAYEQSGLWRSNDEARALATDWLRRHVGQLEAPEELNYKLLVALGHEDFQGRRSVPTLEFVRGDATMKVHVVRESAYRNLKDLLDQPVEEGGCTFLARRYADMPGWVFIIVTSGAAPDNFRRPAGGGPPA